MSETPTTTTSQISTAIHQQKRVYPYSLGTGSARPNPKMGAPDPESPLFLGFSVLGGGLRPWSQTIVSEGARPWGRGRSGDCEYTSQICVAVRLQFVLQCFQCHWALRKGKYLSTPPICIAVGLLFVSQYASYLYRNTFGENLGGCGRWDAHQK